MEEYIELPSYESLDKVSEHLIAYYPLLDDGKDYSGNNHNADVSDKVYFTEGIFGDAATFTQKGAMIKLPIFQRYANKFTLSAWVNLTGDYPTENGAIIGRLYVKRPDKKLRFVFYYDTSDKKADNQSFDLVSKGSLNLNQWHHVLVAYDHSTRHFRFYIDGELDVEHDVSGKIREANCPHLPTYSHIGGEAFRDSLLNGQISQIMILGDSVDQDGVDLLANRVARYSGGRRIVGHLVLTGFAIGVLVIAAGIGWLIKKLKGKGAPDNVNKTYALLCEHDDKDLPLYLVPRPIDHLDAWGEGRINDGGLFTGFDNAYNLNRFEQEIMSGDRAGSCIPNIVPLLDWNDDWKINRYLGYTELLLDNSVLYITVMGSPLGKDMNKSATEIPRIVRKDKGVVIAFGYTRSDRSMIDELVDELRKIDFEEKFDFELKGRFREINLPGGARVFAPKTMTGRIIAAVPGDPVRR